MDSSPKQLLQNQYDLLKTEYIKLLNDKDVLLSWGKPQLEALYNTRIGYLQIERLQSQLRIKSLKRKLELLRSAINQNKPVDIIEIEMQVAAELANAELKIMQEIDKLQYSKDLLSHLSSPEHSAELRKLYRQFAKQLHPDINQNLTDEQINLWYIVKDAYKKGDVEKLKALKLVYEDELTKIESKIDDYSEEEITLKIEVLKEGIKVLNEQILEIKTEFPFTIESQIKDDEWVKIEQDNLNTELQKLKDYEEELTQDYHKIISQL